jgi:TnpA family transposase
MSVAFGTGTLASSDGQRFPVKGKSITARHLSWYFARGQGISTYTAVSDQHATLDTTVIAADAPEGHIVLDGILGNTDPPILEHATDTHGATLANFALFALVGKQLSPPYPGSGQDHPVSARAAGGVRGPLPARWAVALSPAQRPACDRALG